MVRPSLPGMKWNGTQMSLWSWWSMFLMSAVWWAVGMKSRRPPSGNSMVSRSPLSSTMGSPVVRWRSSPIQKDIH